MKSVLALSVLTCVIAGPVLAQNAADTRIQQMNPTVPGQADATGAAQIGLGQTMPIVVQPFAARDRTLGGSEPSASRPTPPSQVTTERGRTDAGAQLTDAAPNANATPSPSTPAQGRNTTTAVPTGRDRCDPRNARALPVACDRVIEARASEFSAPDTQPLSAEQRLLANQRELRPASTDVGSAARRLANGQIDDSNAALAVASIALQGPAKRDEEEETAVDTSATDAIVAGIVNLVTGSPPTP